MIDFRLLHQPWKYLGCLFLFSFIRQELSIAVELQFIFSNLGNQRQHLPCSRSGCNVSNLTICCLGSFQEATGPVTSRHQSKCFCLRVLGGQWGRCTSAKLQNTLWCFPLGLLPSLGVGHGHTPLAVFLWDENIMLYFDTRAPWWSTGHTQYQ